MSDSDAPEVQEVSSEENEKTPEILSEQTPPDDGTTNVPPNTNSNDPANVPANPPHPTKTATTQVPNLLLQLRDNISFVTEKFPSSPKALSPKNLSPKNAYNAMKKLGSDTAITMKQHKKELQDSLAKSYPKFYLPDTDPSQSEDVLLGIEWSDRSEQSLLQSFCGLLFWGLVVVQIFCGGMVFSSVNRKHVECSANEGKRGADYSCEKGADCGEGWMVVGELFPVDTNGLGRAMCVDKELVEELSRDGFDTN